MGNTGFLLASLIPVLQKRLRLKSCADVVKYLLHLPLLLLEMRRSKGLPIKAVSPGGGVSTEILVSHRKYIIASAEMLEFIADKITVSHFPLYVQKIIRMDL